MRSNDRRKTSDDKVVEIVTGAGMLFRLGPHLQLLYLPPKRRRSAPA